MSNEDWITVGIQEAADKYAVNLPAYFEGRDNKGEVAPYVASEKVVSDSGELTPAQKRGLKMFSVAAPITGMSVGIAHVLMTGALNSVLGWCIGGGFAVSVLSGLFGGGSKRPAEYQGRNEYHEHHHYHQNNNFGGAGGANQNNGNGT